MKRQYGIALMLVCVVLAVITGVAARSSMASTETHAAVNVPHGFAHAKGIADLFPQGR